MIPENETINCRVRASDHCSHGKPTTETAMDPDGDGMQEDSTFDGDSVVCDACYIAIGQPTWNGNAGAVGGGRGNPDKQLGKRLEPDEAIALLAVSTRGGDPDDKVVHTARVGSGVFIGADWPFADVEEGVRRFRATMLTRPVIGHGLLIVDGQGPVVLETNPAEFEAAIATASRSGE